LTFIYSELLKIWYVRGVIQKKRSFAFNHEKANNSDTGRSQGHVQVASKSVCTSTVVVSPDPLSPAPSTSSAVKTQDDTKEDPHDPEPAAEGDIQMEYSSD